MVVRRGSALGGLPRMGSNYRHPALKQLKEQQARFAPRERRLEQIDRAEQLLARSTPEKCYPYEYLCFRITGFRPEGRPALVLDGERRPARPAAVRRGPSGTVGQTAEQAARAGPDGRRGEPPVQRLDPDGGPLAGARAGRPPVPDRRAHQGRVPRVEPDAVRRGAPRAGRPGHPVPATDRRGARRDHPPRPPHGAGRPGGPGRDRPEDRTQNGTLHRDRPHHA